jgi:hypothetical protein
MHVSARTYLTSGIAALGAGAIALSPVQPMPDHMNTAAPQRAIESMAVTLAASIDPITPIVETFNTSVANIKTLSEFYMQKPLPLLKTIAANTTIYAEEAANGQAGLIPEQISNNIKTFFQAPWSPGQQLTLTQQDTKEEVTIPYIFCDTPTSCSDTKQPNNGLSTQGLYLLGAQVIAGVSAEDPLSPDGAALWGTFVKLAPALNFLFTPYSGQLLGALGPLLSPVVQLTKSFSAVGEYFKAGDVTGAINELINIPTKTTNAFLNGAGFLDLTSVVEAVLGGPLPINDYFTPNLKLGINLGGLLNAVPRDGSLVDPEKNPVTEWFGLGADALSLIDKPGVDAFFGDQPVYGYPNGPVGGAIALGQYLSDAMLVTPPAPGQSVTPVAAAAVAPKAAAAVEAPATPAVPATPAEPATPAVPAADSAPAAPATDEAPAAPAIPAVVEAPAAPEAPAVSEAPTHRGGGGNNKSDNGSHAKGHRGAA